MATWRASKLTQELREEAKRSFAQGAAAARLGEGVPPPVVSSLRRHHDPADIYLSKSTDPDNVRAKAFVIGYFSGDMKQVPKELFDVFGDALSGDVGKYLINSKHLDKHRVEAEEHILGIAHGIANEVSRGQLRGVDNLADQWGVSRRSAEEIDIAIAALIRERWGKVPDYDTMRNAVTTILESKDDRAEAEQEHRERARRRSALKRSKVAKRRKRGPGGRFQSSDDADRLRKRIATEHRRLRSGKLSHDEKRAVEVTLMGLEWRLAEIES